jgi:type VI secretion system protein ImpC
MRDILHHPDFQAVESAWRALRFCLRKMETDETSMVYLLDCTQSEVTSDLTAHEEIQDTALYKKLSSAALQHGGDSPWTLLAGLYTFTPKKLDVVTLARLGALGEVLGAPFIGAGDTRLVGCPSLVKTPDPSDWTLDAAPDDTKAWRMIRTLPEARWIGLAMPRFIIRLPYGERTDPVDAFNFEEVQDPVDHEDYLWAHPVFSIVVIFARTYAAHGWQWSQGLINDVIDLPIHLVEDDGQQTIKPCAEALLSERALETIISNGLMPLVSIRNQGGVRLARFQSIADPLQVLAGCWALP